MSTSCKIRGYKGSGWNKLLLGFLCVFIWPYFKMKQVQQYTENLIHSLTVYRFNLLKLVKFRRNNIAILYIKYHKNMTKEMQTMCAQIIEADINYYNMNFIELEIEGVHNLVRTTINSRDKMEQDFDGLLYLSEREYNSITQAYYSFYSHGYKTLNRAPWKIFWRMFEDNKLALVF